MKKVVTKNELREKMDIAISLLCDTVKMTLGPKGSNTIIDHSSFSPFITNDGVTIAKNIESEDEVINTILELAKEASINTDDKVGDGTTTTLVLLESIYKNCLEEMDEGINPVILKKELDKVLPEIIEMIKQRSRMPKADELLNIASISAGSKDIGGIVYEAYHKVKNKNAIYLTEANNNESKIIYKKGYILETLIPSLYFFQNKEELELKNSRILITNNCINDIEEMANLLNEVLITKQNLVIFADDFSDYFVEQTLSFNEQEQVSVIPLKKPGYGQNKINILNDLSLISDTKITSNLNHIVKENIGLLSNIKINKKETIISFTMTDKIQEEIKNIQNNLLNYTNDIDYENNSNRLAMFTNGLVEIEIGGPTETERREKKMRFTDALWAIDVANKGVLLGSGIVLLEIAEHLNESIIGFKILSKALKEPFKQIMFNAGLDDKEIYKHIKDNNYQEVYNINTEMYEKEKVTEVIDPTEVVINSLINAISIATMLITTTTLVINEYQNNLNKINEYTDI